MPSYHSEDDYSKYSAFEEGADKTIADSTAAGSVSLADVKYDNQHMKRDKHQVEYSRDEFLYAISSPSSLGAIGWIISSFFAVIYGSSIVVYLNFCIPILVGPYVIKEQMPAQLLPLVQRKFNKIHIDATTLATTNLQLKSIVSRMQRQEYRLSAAEERFEHLCQRSEKDIVKMKQLARKNAALRQKIKINLAGKKLQRLMKSMLLIDHNGKRSISQKDIYEVVILIKDFAGKNRSSKFDKDATQRAVVNSVIRNFRPTNNLNLEPHIETREYDGDDDGATVKSVVERGQLHRNEQEIKESSYSFTDKLGKQQDEMMDDDTRGEDSWSNTENYGKDETSKSYPSDHLQEDWNANEGFCSVKQTNITSGTVDRPIDIEKLLFNKSIPKLERRDANSRYLPSENSEMHNIVTSVE